MTTIDSDPYRVWEQISEEQREQVIDDLIDTFIRKRVTGMRKYRRNARSVGGRDGGGGQR